MKKNFCDGWDNVFTLVIYNLFTVLLILGGWFSLTQFADSPVSFFIVIGAFLLLLMIILSAVNVAMAKLADFKCMSVKDTLLEIPNVIKDSILLAVIFLCLVYLTFFGIPFYLKMGSLVGLFLASVIFWLLVITVLSLQWFFPIKAQLGNDFKKTLKKCFIVFFDNAGFSLCVFIYTTIMFCLSFVLAFFIPGFAGVLLAQNNAFRLLMYKYDWMEAHPEITPKEARKQVPWEELLEEDREIIGPRSLKSFIFPWKD